MSPGARSIHMRSEVVLTNAEITVIFVGLLGMHPRPVDLAVLNIMGATAENTAHYVWDHWLGERTHLRSDR